MITYSDTFDHQFDNIKHYQKYPVMKPYVGINYPSAVAKIMLIAESHYLPKESQASLNPQAWYEGSQRDLNDSERGWINTKQIVSGHWNNGGHRIYKELNNRLGKVITNTDEHRPMASTVFMNGFQRPSPKTGDSIKNFVDSTDLSMGRNTISQVIDIVNPDLVLFTSIYAWRLLGRKIDRKNNIKYDYVCHPGTGGRYWHKDEYSNGCKKFDQLIHTAFL